MNKNYIQLWLDLAIKDLEVSNILFEKKLYSNSLYHFQQASEKALKAYCFLDEIYVSEKDAYKTGHYTLKVFKNSITKNQADLSEIKQYNFDKVIDESLFNDYSIDLDKMTDALPSQKDIFEYSGGMLDEMLKFLKELKDYTIPFPSNFESLLIEKTSLIWESMSQLGEDIVKEIQADFIAFTNDKQNFNQFIGEVKAGYNEILNISYFISILYFCNLISHNHNNLSRYPEIDFNPLKYYTLKRPLIKKLPDFSLLLKNTLIQLKEWNEKISPA